jgi:hypothetical protein
MGMVDGLWAGGSEAATDFALIAYQIRLLGYNAVRLPFIWRDLEQAPTNLVRECTQVSGDQLKKRLISPNVLDRYISKPLPGNVSPMKKADARYCNQYLPTASNYHRLLFVVQQFIAQGMYVILDYQPMVRGRAGVFWRGPRGRRQQANQLAWRAAAAARQLGGQGAGLTSRGKQAPDFPTHQALTRSLLPRHTPPPGPARRASSSTPTTSSSLSTSGPTSGSASPASPTSTPTWPTASSSTS